MYASAGNHHGRGRHATWVKAAPGEQAKMVAANPASKIVRHLASNALSGLTPVLVGRALVSKIVTHDMPAAAAVPDPTPWPVPAKAA